MENNNNQNINQDEQIRLTGEFNALYKKTKLFRNILIAYLVIVVLNLLVSISAISIIYVGVAIGTLISFSKASKDYTLFMNNLSQYYYDEILAEKIKKKFKDIKVIFIIYTVLVLISIALSFVIVFSAV